VFFFWGGEGGSTPDRLKKSGELAVKGERKEDVKGILINTVRNKEVSIVMFVETELYA
jgi:hypothetical protein